MTLNERLAEQVSTSEEYFIRCEVCDDNSTKDGCESIAIRIAEQEGYTIIDGGYGDTAICGNCAAERSE